MNPKSCVVIGAGLSGLAAAHVLTKKNWDVTVLEAQPFIGGRVFSFSFTEAPELVCELGGEWIGADHERMIELCKEFNLKRMPHRFDYFFFEKGKASKQYEAGTWPFSEDAKKEFDHLQEQVKHWGRDDKIVLDKKDWWTILRDRQFNEGELLRRDLMDSTDFGESIRQVGGYSAAAEYFESDRFDEMDTKIVGGNSELIRALEQAVSSRKGRILISHPVKAIIQKEGGVTVQTDHGGVFAAKFCICTVPARTLTKIDFHPHLPDKQWDSAKQLQYARIMKTAILCEKRFWMKTKQTRFSCFTDATSDFLFDATLNQPGTNGILCSYSIGDKADDLDGFLEKDLQAQLATDLKRIFPKAPVRIVTIQKQAWQRNTLTEGAYALYRPGQWFTVREELAKPFGRVYFAGEHIAADQGFMEGAVDTGESAARNILQA